MTDSTTSTDTDVSTAVEDTEDGTGLDTEAHHFDDGAAGHAAIWRSEVIGGGAMVGIVVLVALFFRWRPGSTTGGSPWCTPTSAVRSGCT